MLRDDDDDDDDDVVANRWLFSIAILLVNITLSISPLSHLNITTTTTNSL